MTYPGLYRAVCVSNVDPTGKNRIRIKVPVLFGDEDAGWALPCVPPGWPGLVKDHDAITGGEHSQYSGSGTHTHGTDEISAHELTKTKPAPGSPVWVMFEGGDPEYPVWMGTWLYEDA